MTARDRLLDWLIGQSLPLWSGGGFNSRIGLFEEQLNFDGTPVLEAPLRLMVQCRQIAVFCLAERRGWFTGGTELAASACERIVERYFEADGAAGWVFSIDHDGRPLRRDRDLYTHAFVLFALAWLIRLRPTPKIHEIIRATVTFLDEHLADRRYGGYFNALPARGGVRSQDPHMHLFEALLELHASTGDPSYLARAEALKSHALAKFYHSPTQTLREEFDEGWSIIPGPGHVEPGHHFEWVWLLDRYAKLTSGEREVVGTQLLRTALQFGVDRTNGRIVDEIDETGACRRSTSRLWPHAEALRGLSTQRQPGWEELRHAIVERLLHHYCVSSLGGGWIDRLDENDNPLSTAMPASSLYHIAFALAELH